MSTFDPAPAPEERGCGLARSRLAVGTEPPRPAVPATSTSARSATDGPWVLDPEQIPWRWEIDRLRRGTRHEVPRLLSPRVSVPPLRRLLRTVTAIGGAVAGWLVFEYRRPLLARGHLPSPAAWPSSAWARAT